MTRQLPPRSVPGSPVRGSSTVSDTERKLPALAVPAMKTEEKMVERGGLLELGDVVRRRAADALVERGHEGLLVVLGGEIGLPAQRLADSVELGRDVLRDAEVRQRHPRWLPGG